MEYDTYKTAVKVTYTRLSNASVSPTADTANAQLYERFKGGTRKTIANIKRL